MKMVKGIGALTSRVKRRRLPRQWKIINVLLRTFPLSERLLISTLSAFSYVIGVVWAVWVRWKAAFLKYRPLKAFRRLFFRKDGFRRTRGHRLCNWTHLLFRSLWEKLPPYLFGVSLSQKAQRRRRRLVLKSRFYFRKRKLLVCTELKGQNVTPLIFWSCGKIYGRINIVGHGCTDR